MQSKLPLTGKCHYCGEPTPNRFCNNRCGSLYNYRKKNPVVHWHAKPRVEPIEPETPKECPHGRGKFCTKCRADRKRAEFKKNKSLWNWTM